LSEHTISELHLIISEHFCSECSKDGALGNVEFLLVTMFDNGNLIKKAQMSLKCAEEALSGWLRDVIPFEACFVS